MLTEALKPVNLNLLIGVERARSGIEEPPNSSESLLTTNRSGREFYWHWLWRRGGQCFCAHETTMSIIRPARLRGVRTNKSDCRFPAGRDDICEVVRRSQIYTCKLATCKFWDKCKSSVSSFTENIFENSRKCFSLCWVLVRSRNFRDVEQRRRLCKTRVFFWILQWEWDFGDGKWGLQMKRARKWDWYPRPPPHPWGPSYFKDTPQSLRTLLFQRWHLECLEIPSFGSLDLGFLFYQYGCDSLLQELSVPLFWSWTQNNPQLHPVHLAHRLFSVSSWGQGKT